MNKKSRSISKLISLYLYPVKKAANRNIDFIMYLICRKLRNDDYFVSYRLRPLRPASQNQILKNACDAPQKIAIILQGPITVEDNFTLETIKFYKMQYPDIILIVSTWSDEKESTINALRDDGICVVQSQKPDYSGILNINYQIVSTRAGLKKAEESGVKYVIKSRTDQRICKPNVLYSLCSLLDQFKPQRTEIMQNRIIALSTYVHNMFTPYFLCDFFFVGELKDIQNLFGCELDTRKKFIIENSSRKIYSKTMYPPEIYLIKNYLIKHLDQECSDTIKEYWQCIKDYFICIGRDEIGLFTTKYEYSYMEHIYSSEYSVNDNDEKKALMGFDFWMWLNLYTGNLRYKDEYEKEMEVIF